MKHSERDRLLTEILAGEEVSGFRQTSLELGLRALKTRQRRRQIARICMVCSFALLAGGAVIWGSWQTLSTGRDSAATAPRVATTTAPAPTVAGDVKFISDDELLALFPDRSVALIGKPGHQQLVFLDADKKAAHYE